MNSDDLKRFSLPVAVSVALVLIATSGVVLAASGGGNGGEGGSGWAVTDTYRVMNFAVLAIVLFFLLRKPVAHFFNDRIRVIREQLSDLEQQKTEAENQLAEYNERLSALSKEADSIIEQYRQQGESLREKILQDAETAAAKMEEQARKNIENEFAQAKLQLETEIFEKAIAKAEDKLKTEITDSDQDRLVQEYLDKVVTK